MRWYKVREFAEITGITVRALHHYDRLALLRPRRTQAGYRAYSGADLERLEQIVALRFLGMPLKQIKQVLESDPRGFTQILRAQREALEAQRTRLDHAIAAIRQAEESTAGGTPAHAAMLKGLIKVIAMQENAEFLNKYYSEDAQLKLAEQQKKWNPQMQDDISRQWRELLADVREAMGEDPAGARAQELAARWRALVEAFTGSDAEILSGLRNAWAHRDEWPAGLKHESEEFADPAVRQFIAKAIKAAKPEPPAPAR